jgi:methionyl-tRNA formyltransferase
MGTPDFAVPTLQALHYSEHEILAVVSQPDRPKGRGRKLCPPPVKETASAHTYPMYQPESVRTDAFHRQMRELSPDLFIVVAFGQILPQSLLNIPRIGAINVHASLLPRYRGSAPIHWAIINGEKETG